jgi:quinol monooxygenase YgiN
MHMVNVVWETWLKAGAEEEGLEITRRIWADMTRFEGYVSHFILRDEDEKGHLLVVSEWANREAADHIRDEYADAEPVRLITPLLAMPRKRRVFSKVRDTTDRR